MEEHLSNCPQSIWVDVSQTSSDPVRQNPFNTNFNPNYTPSYTDPFTPDVAYLRFPRQTTDSNLTSVNFLCGKITSVQTTRKFVGIPMISYKFVLEWNKTEMGTISKFLSKGWPFMFQGYEEWLFFKSIDVTNGELLLPLHYKLKEDHYFAPMNQFDEHFENKEIIDFLNATRLQN